ncbi:MAG: HlyC/CorC family transporter [Arenicella sp.]
MPPTHHGHKLVKYCFPIINRKYILDDIPLLALFITLFCLIMLSAVFSASETAMMAVNRYRLKHQADSGNVAAKRVLTLLKSPDRLLGTILIGNNIANIGSSALATVIGLKLYGDLGVGIATGVLLFIVLVFAEVAPKTLAAQYPERIAFPTSILLSALLRVSKPVIYAVNFLANNFLSLFGVKQPTSQNSLNLEELRAAVLESTNTIHSSYQNMLLGVLEMDSITVNDVMIPTNHIDALNFDESIESIAEKITTSRFTRLPVYEKSMENVLGILHLRKILPLIQSGKLEKEALKKYIREPYFIPENLSITKTLNHLQAERRRFALIVDEYGSLKGLVTMEEILEEIVGDFTEYVSDKETELVAKDGSIIVKGDSSIRDLNRKMDWNLPTAHAKTVNGLVLHILEEIPTKPSSLEIEGFKLEILRTSGTLIRSVRISKLQEKKTN